MLASHPLVITLRRLRGNARGCVLTEPLWGIPFNLYAPYVSLYMLAFGLTDAEIGLISSIGMAFQIVWTLLSGAITDKLGRKRTTLIFDIISWSIPTLIWAVAQNFSYFVAAAFVNAVWRVTSNSWQLLLVEDTDPDLLVDIFSWIYIAGLLAAFVSPLTSPLISRFGLIPTMRGLYILAAVMMTAKFFIMNGMVTETQRGIERMHETRQQHIFGVLQGSGPVLKHILRTPATLYTAGLMILLSICWSIRGTFWSIIVSEELRIPAQHLAIYPFVRSITMLLFFFIAMPRLRMVAPRKLMIFGFAGLILSQVLLISAPSGSYALLVLVTMLEGASIPMASTMLDTLAVTTVSAEERARIMALISLTVMVATAPFGWIGGQLSAINRRLPFVLVTLLFAVAAVLTALANRAAQRDAAAPA